MRSVKNINRSGKKNIKTEKNDGKKKTAMLLLGFAAGFVISEAAGNSVVFSICCAAICALVCAFLPAYNERRRKKKELRLYEMDMADYLTGVSLLLSSGLTIWDSLRRALSGTDMKKPLYRDIGRLFDGIDSGRFGDPVEAFEQLASECGSPAVSTLTAAIVQNYKKGSGEIAELLRELSLTARNNRKYLCMKLADEATTLLLIPSTVILIALIILLVAPAVITLSGL